MIHFAQAVRGQSDLGRLMIKQLGEALDSAQPEAFTEAMFKLTALLISTKGYFPLWFTLVFWYYKWWCWYQIHVSLFFWGVGWHFLSWIACRLWSSAPAPPVLVSTQDVYRTWYGNSNCLLGVAAGRTYRNGSTGTYTQTNKNLSLLSAYLNCIHSVSILYARLVHARDGRSMADDCGAEDGLVLGCSGGGWSSRCLRGKPAHPLPSKCHPSPCLDRGWITANLLELFMCYLVSQFFLNSRLVLCLPVQLVSGPEIWDRKILQCRSSGNLWQFDAALSVSRCWWG